MDIQKSSRWWIQTFGNSFPVQDSGSAESEEDEDTDAPDVPRLWWISASCGFLGIIISHYKPL